MNCDFTTSLQDTALSYSDALIAFPFDAQSAPTYDNQTRLLLSSVCFGFILVGVLTDYGSANITSNSAQFVSGVGLSFTSDSASGSFGDNFQATLSSGLTGSFTTYVKYKQINLSSNANDGEPYPKIISADGGVIAILDFKLIMSPIVVILIEPSH